MRSPLPPNIPPRMGASQLEYVGVAGRKACSAGSKTARVAPGTRKGRWCAGVCSWSAVDPPLRVLPNGLFVLRFGVVALRCKVEYDGCTPVAVTDDNVLDESGEPIKVS